MTNETTKKLRGIERPSKLVQLNADIANRTKLQALYVVLAQHYDMQSAADRARLDADTDQLDRDIAFIDMCFNA